MTEALGAEQPCDCAEPDSQPRGLWFYGRPRGFAKTTGAFVWLAFLVFPAVNAFARHGTTLGRGLTIAGAVAFVGAYVGLVLFWRGRQADRILPVLFLLLVATASALSLSDGASRASCSRTAPPEPG